MEFGLHDDAGDGEHHGVCFGNMLKYLPFREFFSMQ